MYSQIFRSQIMQKKFFDRFWDRSVVVVTLARRIWSGARRWGRFLIVILPMIRHWSDDLCQKYSLIFRNREIFQNMQKKIFGGFFICDRNHRFFWSLPTIPMIRRIFYRFSQIFHRFFTDFSDFRLWRTWEDMGSATTDFVPDQMIVVQKYSLIFRSQNMQKKFFDRFWDRSVDTRHVGQKK